MAALIKAPLKTLLNYILQSSTWRRLSISLQLFTRYISRSKGSAVRALLCWLIGCLLLSSDEVTSYDSRFQMRGPQPLNSQIVLITLHPEDFPGGAQLKASRLAFLDDLTDVTDSFFWDSKLWYQMLKKILSMNPQKVGISLYFGPSILTHNLSNFERQIFQDPRVIWGSLNNTERSNDRSVLPAFANNDLSNIGALTLQRDDDGVIRKIPSNNNQGLKGNHLVEKLVAKNWSLATADGSSKYINFRKPSGILNEISIEELFDEKLPRNFLENKIILIGADNNSASSYLTPLGPALRHEVFAQIADNLIEDRWIHRTTNTVYAFGLLALMLLSLFCIHRYPQSVAFVMLIWLGTLTLSLSAWIFDVFYFWIPAISPIFQITATWIIFVGYQVHQIEKQNLQLQQEQKYLAELEQLKNNFVSLISHDLKTPIAKIQAIVDRLMMLNPESIYTKDLRSLRMSSEELNRYIQSILKVLRVESRDLQLNKEIVDINDLINEAISQLQPLAQEKNITIDTNLEPLFSIEADMTLIREVLINIIDNAIKYTMDGSNILVTSQEASDKVWVEIIDHGEGIAPEELPNIWLKFVRGKDQEMKTKGTGLGLYLVKYFIELHGGEVYIQSELKKGTKVSFFLPFETAETETI